MTMEVAISKSRTYVAICNKIGEPGCFCSKFTLPDNIKDNNTGFASWYYLNRVDLTSAVLLVMSFEDYKDLREFVFLTNLFS